MLTAPVIGDVARGELEALQKDGPLMFQKYDVIGALRGSAVVADTSLIGDDGVQRNKRKRRKPTAAG